MATTSTLAATLLELGVLFGCVLAAQVIAVRHLPIETIPAVLRGRVELCSRLRPLMLVVAIAMAGAGVVIALFN